MTEAQQRDQNAINIGNALFAQHFKFSVTHGESNSNVTLKFDIIGRSYTKTISYAMFLQPARVEHAWAELLNQYDQDFPTGNVPVVINNPEEDDMSQEEAIAKYHSTVDAAQNMALGQLYNDGKSEGGNFTKEEVEKAVNDAIAALPPDTTPFDQAHVTAEVTKAVAEALAALPADQTPFSKEDMEKAVADALATAPTDESLKAELAAVKEENAKMKLAIQTEIEDSKMDTTRLESVLAPVLPPSDSQPQV